MKAIIFKPSKSVTQSGRGRKKWKLQFIHDGSREIENIMGWTSSSDTSQQVTLLFDTEEQAINYTKKHKIAYIIHNPHERKLIPKSYASNFL